MREVLSENDLKMQFSLLNRKLGEKYMNQYRFDDKFCNRVITFFEEQQKEGQKSTLSEECKGDERLFNLESSSNEESSSDGTKNCFAGDNLDKIFDYKNLFGD